ncbi:MAG: GNAT family N-acetyltransferase [Lachnospiraceae bacterium]|nr:GNAT family N-acetyltransferase [Lachnospiraceae bacterium]
MSELQFKKLERNDSDIAVLRELHSDPSVKKWLSIGDNYFEYCTSTQNVQYIKILLSGVIIGGIHIERDNDILYLSIFIASEYRQKGYARECIGYIIDEFTEGINFIKVSIEEENIPSIKLFESLGFAFADQEEELKNYVLNL